MKSDNKWDPTTIRPTNETVKQAVEGLRNHGVMGPGGVIMGDYGSTYGSWAPPKVR